MESMSILKGTRQDEEYAVAVTSYLASILDKLADYNSTLCRWVPKGEFIGSTFSRQSLSMIWDFVETNPFSKFTGSWNNATEWVTKAIKDISTIPSITNINVINGDVTRLNLDSNKFDAVITDPPYYDSITYAEISDFFYVWLKRTLGQIKPNVFRTPLTPKEREIIHNSPRHNNNEIASKEFYEKLLSEAFMQ